MADTAPLGGGGGRGRIIPHLHQHAPAYWHTRRKREGADGPGGCGCGLKFTRRWGMQYCKTHIGFGFEVAALNSALLHIPSPT